MPSYVAKIPVPIPPPFDASHPDWLAWISLLDGKSLLLEERTSCMSPDLQKMIPGHYVSGSNIPNPPGIAVTWLPLEWIHERTTSQTQSSSCDCSSRDLFIYGCKGH